MPKNQTKKDMNRKLARNNKVKVVDNGDGTGSLTLPFYNAGPTRLPSNEADYLAQARPQGRKATPQETLIKDLHSRGFSVASICVKTGIAQLAVCKLLSLPLSGEDFDNTTLEIRKIKGF